MEKKKETKDKAQLHRKLLTLAICSNYSTVNDFQYCAIKDVSIKA